MRKIKIPSVSRTAPAQPFVLMIAALLLSALAWSEPERPSADIIGFRLGMTPAEVEANFRKLNPAVDLQQQQASYRYSDGLTTFNTEPFLSSISGLIAFDRYAKISHTVTATFSPPPGEPRVVQIYREQKGIPNPTTAAELKAALVAKYGAPSQERHGLEWSLQSNRVRCHSGAGLPDSGNLTALITVQDRDKFLADPSQCAALLFYHPFGIGNALVREMTAQMVDVENAVRANQAANAWVAGLEATAVAARQAKAQGPQL
ncbi:MAG: hypothetical protein RBS22_14185 [Spongiibacteraceae bacterium]|jgi:hypothetical protein|nr:hypothetical protein [Spongiibacteraceae bacterium]